MWNTLDGLSDLWKDEGFLKQSWSGESCESHLLRQHQQQKGSEGSRRRQEKEQNKDAVLAGAELWPVPQGALEHELHHTPELAPL